MLEIGVGSCAGTEGGKARGVEEKETGVDVETYGEVGWRDWRRVSASMWGLKLLTRKEDMEARAV